jgi:uncharacterized repeat protein (TIGR02543 family)
MKKTAIKLMMVALAAVALFAIGCSSPSGGASTTCTVTYSANGASGNVPVDSTVYKSGDTVTVLGNIGTPPLSKSFAASPECGIFRLVVVGPHTVTYDPNGASGGIVPTDSTSYSPGTTVAVKGNTGALAKTGYAFAGWSLTPGGARLGSTFLMGSSNVTLYAVWAPFGGWNTKADGSGTQYAAGQTFTITSDVTLYAMWASVAGFNRGLEDPRGKPLHQGLIICMQLPKGLSPRLN